MFSSLAAFVITTFAIMPSLSSAAVISTCTSSSRLASARAIPHAYNLKTLGESAAAFEGVPFAKHCKTAITPNGLPAIQVANTAASTRAFADETRQIFSEVTGRYEDFTNGTTIIATNVTMGALHLLPVPFTFSANVYLDFNMKSCEIEEVHAYATIPSRVLGIILNPPEVHPID